MGPNLVGSSQGAINDSALFGSSRTDSLSRKWSDAVVRDEAIAPAIAEERNAAAGRLQASESVREDPNKAKNCSHVEDQYCPPKVMTLSLSPYLTSSKQI